MQGKIYSLEMQTCVALLQINFRDKFQPENDGLSLIQELNKNSMFVVMRQRVEQRVGREGVRIRISNSDTGRICQYTQKRTQPKTESLLSTRNIPMEIVSFAFSLLRFWIKQWSRTMLIMRRKTPPTETLAIIMKGISDFSSSKLLARVFLASGGGASEIKKHLVLGPKTHRRCVSPLSV